MLPYLINYPLVLQESIVIITLLFLQHSQLSKSFIIFCCYRKYIFHSVQFKLNTVQSRIVQLCSVHFKFSPVYCNLLTAAQRSSNSFSFLGPVQALEVTLLLCLVLEILTVVSQSPIAPRRFANAKYSFK